MQGPQLTPPTSRQQRPRLSESHTPTINDIRATRRTSSSASTTDYEETFSDPESAHDAIVSPVQSHQSSRTTSPGEQTAPSKKSKSSGLRLSLKNLRVSKISSHFSSDEQSSELPSGRASAEGSRSSFGRRTSADIQQRDGRTSFDSIDPRRRDQLSSPPQISTSAPKSSNRFSFIHSPTPSTPTMSRSAHSRSHTTPTNSPNPSSYGTSPRKTMTSPSPRPVKETHVMMKDYDPATGNKMINKYMVVRELGRGVHGKVKLCRDTETDELCAIKIVDKTTRRRLGRAQLSNEQKIRREIAIMKKCIHPNVVRLIEVIDDPNARKIYLVLEYMEGGEVRWKDVDDKPILSLEDARSIFRDIVLGLEYLHIQGIIHRDIKPANLLLSGDGTVKISDFGVSHFSEKNALEHDLESSPSVDRVLPTPVQSNPFESFFRHANPHSPFPQTISGHQQTPGINSMHQWGDDLELAKTAGSPAFFAPELCYASEFSPAMSPALSSASQTSFILSPPTPRTIPSTPTGTFSIGSGQGYAPRPPITKAIDVWALGVTLYCFVYGRCPFIAETEFELFNIIPRKQPTYLDSVPGRENVCESLKNLLSRLLEKDVAKRITLKEVKEHSWVTEDLKDPERWRIETDPGNYQKVQITDDDLKGAVTIIDKIKNRIRRLSVSLSNLTRRRSKSISSSNTPESPSGPRSPISIMRSPVATTSQSAAHAIAQPPTYISPVSLPERFQHIHSLSNAGSNSTRSDQLERPTSVYSNTSSIEEVDEGEDQSGSGSSVNVNTTYVGRRRVLRAPGHQSQPGSYEGRPLSSSSYLSTSSRRNYSDDHLDQSNSPYNGRPLSGGASFSGLPSARIGQSNQSNLSRSWVYSLPSDTSFSGSSNQLLSGQVQQHEQQLSHRSSTLSPSSTLVSDIMQDQTEQDQVDQDYIDKAREHQSRVSLQA